MIPKETDSAQKTEAARREAERKKEAQRRSQGRVEPDPELSRRARNRDGDLWC